jgi:hypothetical protein
VSAEGNEPVFAYIASSPQPQHGITERIDAPAAKTLASPDDLDEHQAAAWMKQSVAMPFVRGKRR